jgi:hypothetical protein
MDTGGSKVKLGRKLFSFPNYSDKQKEKRIKRESGHDLWTQTLVKRIRAGDAVQRGSARVNG